MKGAVASDWNKVSALVEIESGSHTEGGINFDFNPIRAKRLLENVARVATYVKKDFLYIYIYIEEYYFIE